MANPTTYTCYISVDAEDDYGHLLDCDSRHDGLAKIWGLIEKNPEFAYAELIKHYEGEEDEVEIFERLDVGKIRHITYRRAIAPDGQLCTNNTLEEVSYKVYGLKPELLIDKQMWDGVLKF